MKTLLKIICLCIYTVTTSQSLYSMTDLTNITLTIQNNDEQKPLLLDHDEQAIHHQSQENPFEQARAEARARTIIYARTQQEAMEKLVKMIIKTKYETKLSDIEKDLSELSERLKKLEQNHPLRYLFLRK